MTEHPHQLFAIEFTEADQAGLVGFSRGEEQWSRHVAQWIQGSDALNSMKRGTRVWLFETPQREVVGFGSLGTSQWRWPSPKGDTTTILLIPMLGIDVRFHGQRAAEEEQYRATLAELERPPQKRNLLRLIKANEKTRQFLPAYSSTTLC